ncbi:hypothetical protein [Sedimenticola sp.]|uniref:hypothetical protein n=1 Tax=Sedimenticola sp. TaxID=1940285 RepID=UPI003D1174C7
MNIPKTKIKWAEEAFDAFNQAYTELADGKSPLNTKYELFRIAPVFASINREINGTDRGMSMLSVIEEIERDFEVDIEAEERYLFNFVYVYIHSHTYADLLDGMEADRMMDYINDNYELFEDV